MGNAGRNGGEYYTPRPLIRAMIQVVKPKIGERIYDGACGSAGFLCEAFDYLTRDREKLSTKDLNTLQTRTFYGKEKKSLAYVIGIMNMKNLNKANETALRDPKDIIAEIVALDTESANILAGIGRML